jgi:hypothetical protein
VFSASGALALTRTANTNRQACSPVRPLPAARGVQAASDGFGGGFQGHMEGLEWEFAVVDSPQVNAFVVPGGKVVVFTGEWRRWTACGHDCRLHIWPHTPPTVLCFRLHTTWLRV